MFLLFDDIVNRFIFDPSTIQQKEIAVMKKVKDENPSIAKLDFFEFKGGVMLAKLYALKYIATVSDLLEKDHDFERQPFMGLLKRFFEDQGLRTDWDSLGEADDELLINSLSMLCPFEPEDKQALLEAPSLSTRRETLVTLIEFALRGGTAEEVMQ